MGQENQSGNERKQQPNEPVSAVDQTNSQAQQTNVENSADTPSGKLVMMGRQHIGPLPSPEDLRGYEEALPGTAEAIVSAFKSETPHRHEMERQSLESNIKRDRSEESYAKRGQLMGFAIAMLGIGGGVALIWRHPTLAGTLGGVGITGATLASIVIAFIKGRKSINVNDNDQQSE